MFGCDQQHVCVMYRHRFPPRINKLSENCEENVAVVLLITIFDYSSNEKRTAAK